MGTMPPPTHSGMDYNQQWPETCTQTLTHADPATPTAGLATALQWRTVCPAGLPELNLEYVYLDATPQRVSFNEWVWQVEHYYGREINFLEA